MWEALERIRAATAHTPYEGRVYLVGGVLRDRVLGLPPAQDVDLVVEEDAVALAHLLRSKGVAERRPTVYPRFGTAMVSVAGVQVEFVTARAERYGAGSRKPTVRRATLRDDVLRRDFTINTLLENLHSAELLDLTGRALADLREGVIRTPLAPEETFHDDPLRMLRAVRFAARLGFRVEERAWQAIEQMAGRLNLMGPASPVVSAERIRDEVLKTLLSPDPAGGMEMLRRSGLLRQFWPELQAMVGVAQNAWHSHDVWDHTMLALRSLALDAGQTVRLAVLLHDVGKPATRSEDPRGVHFYEHQFVGADMARVLLQRLRLPNDEVREVTTLVALHMRLGEMRSEWSDAAVRRLIRDTSAHLGALFLVARADTAAMSPAAPVTDLDAVRARIEAVNREADAARMASPLDGNEIMVALGVAPGPVVGEAKEMLVNEVIEGRLRDGDKAGALDRLRAWSAARGA
ncbi:MAG: HD domain-containing protein [Chthonomonadales bacterium]|nr:HD domain-containing protein [Chthonomonadales bacterium]